MSDSLPVMMSGLELLARIPELQSQLDRRNGLQTGGIVTGYRGSPLAALDKLLEQNAARLAKANVKHIPALNEEIAIGIIQGAQEVGDSEDRRVAGAFGFWYGKAPGLARSIDALRHSVLVGAHRNGGALLWVGDDPNAISSRYSQTSELLLRDAGIPVLVPRSVQDILDQSMIGMALSRASGLWVALLLESDIIDTRVQVDLSLDRLAGLLPASPGDGVRLSRNELAPAAERLHHEQRQPLGRTLLTQAFPATSCGRGHDLVIAAAGQAANMARDGIALFAARHPDRSAAVGLISLPFVHPISGEHVLNRLNPAGRVLVADNRARFLTDALRSATFGSPDAPSAIDAVWDLVDAAALAGVHPGSHDVLAALETVFGLASEGRARNSAPPAERLPFYCAGCPSNRSTLIPEGATSLGGVGCHLMSALVPEARGDGIPQMGGEGANWIGRSQFLEGKHAFQDLGDGTFMHSGSLAVRAAVAAGSTMTFKVLVNGVVGMTGGQPIEGNPDALSIARILDAEGVGEMWVLCDDARLPPRRRFPSKCHFGRTDDLARVQDRLRQRPGVTALLYVEDCATVKAAGRPPPTTRVEIDLDICEGCDDCVVQSRCIALHSVDSSDGKKRQVAQHLCNLELGCLSARCPAFVTSTAPRLEEAAETREPPGESVFEGSLPLEIVIAGVGGTGVVSAGRELAEAAVRAGLTASCYSNPGLSQRGALVVSHVRIGLPSGPERTGRLAPGRAGLLICTDPVTATQGAVLDLLAPTGSVTILVGNYDLQPRTNLFSNHEKFSSAELAAAALVRLRDRAERLVQVDASEAMGDGFALSLLGAAMANGLLPVSAEHFPAPKIKERLARGARFEEPAPKAFSRSAPPSLEQMQSELRVYGGAKLAERWQTLLDDSRRMLQGDADAQRICLELAAAHRRLLAPKDAIEVARLILARRPREGTTDLAYHLGLPLPFVGGRKVALPADAGRFLLQPVAALRHLRGGLLDPTVLSSSARIARRTVEKFEAEVRGYLEGPVEGRAEALRAAAAAAARVRGFGEVRRQAALGYLGDCLVTERRPAR